MKQEIKIGQQDYSVLIFIPDSASTVGAGKSGLVAADLTCSYTRVETDNDVVNTDVTATLNDLANLTAAHADWGLKEVSATLAKGLYRLDIADAVYATGAWSAVVYVCVTTGLAAASPMEFVLIPESPYVGVSLASILGTLLTETSGGLITAAFKKFFDKAAPTGTVNSLPDAVPDANGGLGLTNGTKFNKTVDLTAGQSIACSDKTGFSLSATGADLILKSSTFVQAIVAAVNEFATYGLTALNTLLVTTGIKAASVPAVTLANGAHGGAGASITLATPIVASVSSVPDSAGVTTLLGQLTGITVLANWLRGLFRKDAMNAAAKTEINSGGGTFDETTDSIQAIRDTAPLGTAMRGTDSAALASVCTETRLAELDAANLPTDVAAISPAAIAAAVRDVNNQTPAALSLGLAVNSASAPTTAQVADKVQGRNLAGGADGGRTVSDALRFLRNKVVINPVTNAITIYAEDDVTPAWTGVLTTTAGALPITGVDPA